MPFAHCIDCGSSALIDPSGRCPEGHIVGAAGARVSAAIGSDEPHPDEPQPWVSELEVDPVVVEIGSEPRTVRPPSLPSVEPVTGTAGASPESADDLLRELHALGDLGAVTADTAPLPVRPVRPVTEPAAPPLHPAAATAPRVPSAPPASAPAAPAASTSAFDTPAPPSSPEDATDLTSLANLAAAVRSLGDRAEDAARVAETTTGRPTTPDTSAADLDELLAVVDAGPAPSASASATPASTAPPGSEVDTTQLAPVADHTDRADHTRAVDPVSPFAGGFTARGESVGRGGAAKGGRRGLFRR